MDGRFSFIKKSAEKNSDISLENVHQLELSLQGTGRLFNTQLTIYKREIKVLYHDYYIH